MSFDRPSLVRIGQAVNACYAPFFLDRPERAALPAPHHVVWGTDGDGPRPYGAIYFDPGMGLWICALRGTDSMAEWQSDADCPLGDCPFLPGARTHRGFTAIYQSMIVDGLALRAFLSSKSRPLIVTGHSLGAALATLVAADVGGVNLVTFAGPRVGDDAFAHMAMTRLAGNDRLVNAPDIVPRVPVRIEPDFPYAHLGVSIDLDSAGQVIENVHAWHSLDTYLHMIDPTVLLDPQFVPSPATT